MKRETIIKKLAEMDRQAPTLPENPKEWTKELLLIRSEWYQARHALARTLDNN